MGNPDKGNRFLSLTGIIIELGYVRSILQPHLEKIKSKYFNSHLDDPIVLHRKELVNKKPPFSILQHTNIEKKFTFSDKILSIVEKTIFQYDGKRLGYGIKKTP